MSLKLVIGSVSTTALVAGGVAAFYLGMGGFRGDYSYTPTQIFNESSFRNTSVFGVSKPRYFNHLESLDKTTREHVPFHSSEKSNLESGVGSYYLVDKKDIIFSTNTSNSTVNEDEKITWSCELDITDGDKSSKICNFFVFPTIPEGKKCSTYFDDLVLFSFKHITSINQLPPKILVSVNEYSFNDDKKITLKKNGVDYFSINLKGKRISDKCKLLFKKHFEYFLVESVPIEDKNKKAEQGLFITENNKKTKNYMCKDDYGLSVYSSDNKTAAWDLRTKDEDCEIYEFDVKDKKLLNLSDSISPIVKQKQAEKIDDKKLYILKIQKYKFNEVSDRYLIDTKNLTHHSIYLDKNNKEKSSTFDGSHIRLYDAKGEKIHSRLKWISKISLTYDEKKPDIYDANASYIKKLFIAKATNNSITTEDISDFKCTDFPFWKMSLSKNSSEQDCKIYKFDGDLKDIKNLSFNKPAIEITNSSKSDIKNDSYYIIDFPSEQKIFDDYGWNSHKNFHIGGNTFSFRGKSFEQKVDFVVEAKFYGDYKKAAADDNNFFIFNEGSQVKVERKKTKGGRQFVAK